MVFLFEKLATGGDEVIGADVTKSDTLRAAHLWCRSTLYCTWLRTLRYFTVRLRALDPRMPSTVPPATSSPKPSYVTIISTMKSFLIVSSGVALNQCRIAAKPLNVEDRAYDA